ncbi:hypothetical protein [Clavibacter tessellarius]|uniref:hypothetical protein n=1 Tax=Clavibacter tessellarius TaxID=31965 RepID=UPI00324B2175
MVALVLRLRLALLANAFRRSPWQVLGLVVAAVYGILVTVLAIGALAGLRDADVSSARDIVVAGERSSSSGRSWCPSSSDPTTPWTRAASPPTASSPDRWRWPSASPRW